ncbi:2-oxoglutarate ferredoxin oxidoreductase subunit delta [Desulfovibrionales bacterium]
MPRVTFLDERCKGCLLCATVCKPDIITQSTRINQKGYKVAEVVGEAMTRCTGCASCAMICPDFAIRVFKEIKHGLR